MTFMLGFAIAVLQKTKAELVNVVATMDRNDNPEDLPLFEAGVEGRGCREVLRKACADLCSRANARLLIAGAVHCERKAA